MSAIDDYTYIGRLNGNGPWLVATNDEARELEEMYGKTECIIVPTETGIVEMRRMPRQRAEGIAHG